MSQARRERFALDELHDTEQALFGFEQLVDVADVRMVERGGRQCLGPEPVLGLLVGRLALANRLDGDRAFELLVVGLVDDAHAAGANGREDLVVSDHACEHWRPQR